MATNINNILFVCDKRKSCKSSADCGIACKHTTDVRHAINFNYLGGSHTTLGYPVFEEVVAEKEKK